MEAKQRTLDYALKVLDAQKENCESAPADKVQHGYYCGMLMMLNVIISNAYENTGIAVEHINGKHIIRSNL